MIDVEHGEPKCVNFILMIKTVRDGWVMREKNVINASLKWWI